MPRRIVTLALVSISTSLLASLGCGDSHPPVDSSLTEATVKGVVKIQGKSAQGGGEIRFNPSNVERKVATKTAKIEEDGSYTLTTYTGLNEVKFSGPFLKDHPQLALASRYSEIKVGENVVIFDLLGANDNTGEESSASSIPAGVMPRGARRKKATTP
jgi:hypothetical protein